MKQKHVCFTWNDKWGILNILANIYLVKTKECLSLTFLNVIKEATTLTTPQKSCCNSSNQRLHVHIKDSITHKSAKFFLIEVSCQDKKWQATYSYPLFHLIQRAFVQVLLISLKKIKNRLQKIRINHEKKCSNLQE